VREVRSVGQPEYVTFKDGGGMHRYPLVMDDGSEAVAWRPNTSNPPKVGDRGEVTPKGKFTKAGSGGGRNGGGYHRRDPEEVAGMQRAHAQEMALRYFAIKGEVGSLENLETAIDWFCEDVQAAVQRVRPKAAEPEPFPATPAEELPAF
jgi:hypothetical protein